MLNKTKLDYEGHEIRCKPDAPIEERVPLILLLGLRWQLGEWGFNKKDIKVDGDGLVTMTVADEPVVSAEIKNDRVHLTWLDATWQEWKDLQNSEELQKLMVNASKKVEHAADHQLKGMGKGKGGKSK